MKLRKRLQSGVGLSGALAVALAQACSDGTATSANDAGSSGGADSQAEQDRDARVDSGGSEGGNPDASSGAADGGGERDSGSRPECSTLSAPRVPRLAVEIAVPSAGLSRLVNAAQAPGSDDWYLVEQTGLIRVYANGRLQDSPLLDIRSDVANIFSDSDERGLLGLAFSPSYQADQLFYVALTVTADNHDEVREYKYSNGAATLQRVLVQLEPSAGNHNGGTVAFGPDGLLYVGTGDGGGACDDNKPDQPQRPTSLFGKILRLDPRVQTAPYAAAGNPYPNAPTVAHIGLRNPFRFSVDAPSRTIFIGDVGQSQYEELNAVGLDDLGKNFGWAAYEGLERTCGGRDLGAQTEWERPIFVADRRGGNQCSGDFCDWESVLGGVVYRGTAIPQLTGVHIFGDYVGRRMVALTHCEGKTSAFTPINKVCDPNNPSEACLEGSDIFALTAIVRDNAGEVYLVSGNALLKIVPGT